MGRVFFLLVCLWAGGVALPAAAADNLGSPGPVLEQGFAHPPPAARPRVWWHWMNGNVTLTGIREDLEWMRRVGLGGLQNFDGATDTPQVVLRISTDKIW